MSKSASSTTTKSSPSAKTDSVASVKTLETTTSSSKTDSDERKELAAKNLMDAFTDMLQALEARKQNQQPKTRMERKMKRRMKRRKPFPLMALPDEILVQIISHIRAPGQKVRLGQLCRRLNRLVKTRQAWTHDMELRAESDNSLELRPLWRPESDGGKKKSKDGESSGSNDDSDSEAWMTDDSEVDLVDDTLHRWEDITIRKASSARVKSLLAMWPVFGHVTVLTVGMVDEVFDDESPIVLDWIHRQIARNEAPFKEIRADIGSVTESACRLFSLLDSAKASHFVVRLQIHPMLLIRKICPLIGSVTSIDCTSDELTGTDFVNLMYLVATNLPNLRRLRVRLDDEVINKIGHAKQLVAGSEIKLMEMLGKRIAEPHPPLQLRVLASNAPYPLKVFNAFVQDVLNVMGISQYVQPLPLLSLPDEVLLRIISFIEKPVPKVQLGQLCRRLNRLVKDKRAWIHEMELRIDGDQDVELKEFWRPKSSHRPWRPPADDESDCGSGKDEDSDGWMTDDCLRFDDVQDGWVRLVFQPRSTVQSLLDMWPVFGHVTVLRIGYIDEHVEQSYVHTINWMCDMLTNRGLIPEYKDYRRAFREIRVQLGSLREPSLRMMRFLDMVKPGYFALSIRQPFVFLSLYTFITDLKFLRNLTSFDCGRYEMDLEQFCRVLYRSDTLFPVLRRLRVQLDDTILEWGKTKKRLVVCKPTYDPQHPPIQLRVLIRDATINLGTYKRLVEKLLYVKKKSDKFQVSVKGDWTDSDLEYGSDHEEDVMPMRTIVSRYDRWFNRSHLNDNEEVSEGDADQSEEAEQEWEEEVEEGVEDFESDGDNDNEQGNGEAVEEDPGLANVLQYISNMRDVYEIK